MSKKGEHGEVARRVEGLLRADRAIWARSALHRAKCRERERCREAQAIVEYIESLQDRLAPVLSVREQKWAKNTYALELARWFLEKYPNATDAEVSRETGVHRATIGRWRRGTQKHVKL